jgi:SAM-dependent methyltransferase
LVEINSPGVDADELMRRVRAEVARRRTPPTQQSPIGLPPPRASLDLETELVLPPDLSSVEERLLTAQKASAVGAHLPAMSKMRGLKRFFAVGVARAFLRTAELITRDQRTVNQAVIDSLSALGLVIREQGSKVAGRLNQVAASQDSQAAEVWAAGREHSARVADVEARLAALIQSTDARLGLQGELAPRIDQIATEASTRAKSVQLDFEALGRQVASLSVELASKGKEVAEQKDLLETLKDQLAAHQKDAAGQRAECAGQLERLVRWTEEVGASLPKAASEEPDLLDDKFYLAFEDAFRGSRKEIKERAREHLSSIQAAGAGTEASPIVDLGSGSGEWLELLKEEHMVAVGVDVNQALATRCRDLGLEVIEKDCLAYLQGLPDQSVGAVTAIHLIEHLPFGKMVRLIDQSIRVLRQGGVVIFETPNPTNVLVGASTFHSDPTHRHPLHPDTMRLLLESRGLLRVSVVPLHPYEPGFRVPEESSVLARRFNDYFYGPRDFAVIGYRA